MQMLVKMIFFQSQLMLCFVNDLLDLKQMKHGVFKQIMTIFDPAEVLQLMIDMFSYQAEAQKVKLGVTIKPSPYVNAEIRQSSRSQLPFLRGDRTRFQ